MLSNEELDQTAQPLADIKTLVQEKFATWIVRGTIDAEWDAYLAQLNTLGLEQVNKVYQDAYDRYAANA